LNDDRHSPDRIRRRQRSFYSRNRNGEHPNQHLAGYAGIFQADAYAGFANLYDAKRRPGPISEAACWSHGRRKFFLIAEVAKAPLVSRSLASGARNGDGRRPRQTSPAQRV
jgi:hypothetical protein